MTTDGHDDDTLSMRIAEGNRKMNTVAEDAKTIFRLSADNSLLKEELDEVHAALSMIATILADAGVVVPADTADYWRAVEWMAREIRRLGSATREKKP